MALLALRLEDRRDVLGERHLFGCVRREAWDSHSQQSGD